jgi:hypothetical protein
MVAVARVCRRGPPAAVRERRSAACDGPGLAQACDYRHAAGRASVVDMPQQLHEEELDRFVDQTLVWSPKVALARLLDVSRGPDAVTSEFFRRGTARFYQIGRRGSRRPVFTGVTDGSSVADCVAEHLQATVDRRSAAPARRLMTFLRHPGRLENLWVTQVPLTAMAVDPTDPLSVQATLLMLQSRSGAEIVNPGTPAELPRTVRGGPRWSGREAMAASGGRRHAKARANRPVSQGKSQKDYDPVDDLERYPDITDAQSWHRGHGEPVRIASTKGSKQADRNALKRMRGQQPKKP